MKFELLDGRIRLYQWDLFRKLVVNDPTVQFVHFQNADFPTSLVCKVYEFEGKRVADIPNILLTLPSDITAFAYVENHVTYSYTFPVVNKAKPSDYLYEETGVIDVDKRLEQKIDKTSIANDLNGGEDRVLSAEQGKELKSQIDAIKVPTKVSELDNDTHFITNDAIPKISDWALKETKPVYTAAEVGADDRGIAVTLMENHNNPKTLAHKDIRDELDKKINSNSIVNDLITGGAQVPLAAEQGKILNQKILDNAAEINTKQDAGDYLERTEIADWAKQPNKPNYTFDEVGAEKSGTAVEAVTAHNSDLTSHADIRKKIEDQGQDLSNKISSIKIPTKVSELTNDTGYVTEVPDVPAWAMEPNKPKYSFEEVGAEKAGAVTAHNQDPNAHSDIRTEISNNKSEIEKKFNKAGHEANKVLVTDDAGNVVYDVMKHFHVGPTPPEDTSLFWIDTTDGGEN